MNRRAYLGGGNARYPQTGRCLQISETDFPREFRSFSPTFSSKVLWRSFQQLYWKTCVIPKWLKIIPILWWLTGCAAAVPALPLLSGLIPAPGGTQILTTTAVNLSEQNFKIVKTNAIGSSVGFSFLGLIPLKSPGYDEAITKLYQNASVSEGKAQDHRARGCYRIYRRCCSGKKPRCREHSLKTCFKSLIHRPLSL